jgi:lysophospholipase L1-like esterase
MSTEIQTRPTLAGSALLSADALVIDRASPRECDRVPMSELFTGLSLLGPAVDVKNSGRTFQAFPRNSTVVQIGDSNTDGRPGWAIQSNYEWFGRGGAFEGWTNNNIGQNGSLLQNWVLSIPSGDSTTPVDTRGSLWAAVNAKPKVILFRLGTNDQNSPTNRATNGTLTTFRANMLTAVNFLLTHCDALIILVLPQPFAAEDFIVGAQNVTQWGTTSPYVGNVALDASDASGRMRQIYQEWQGRHDRVLVVDTHTHLFGNSCDNKAVNAQDPWGQGALITDSLHMTDLGYRRLSELVANVLRPTLPYKPRSVAVPDTVVTNALWGGSLYCASRSGNTLTLYLNPQLVVGGDHTLDIGSVRTVPVTRVDLAEAVDWANQVAVFRQLVNAGGGSGIPGFGGSVHLKFVSSGNEYVCDYVQNTNLVAGTGSTPAYSQANLVNVSPALDVGDVSGIVRFWVTTPEAVPYAGWHRYEDLLVGVSAGQTLGAAGVKNDGANLALKSVSGFRGSGTNVVTVELRVANQSDGRYVLSGDANSPYAAGKTFAKLDFASGIYQGTATLDPNGYFGTTTNIILKRGEFVRAVVTSGTLAGDFTGTVSWRG